MVAGIIVRRLTITKTFWKGQNLKGFSLFFSMKKIWIWVSIFFITKEKGELEEAKWMNKKLETQE